MRPEGIAQQAGRRRQQAIEWLKSAISIFPALFDSPAGSRDGFRPIPHPHHASRKRDEQE